MSIVSRALCAVALAIATPAAADTFATFDQTSGQVIQWTRSAAGYGGAFTQYGSAEVTFNFLNVDMTEIGVHAPPELQGLDAIMSLDFTMAEGSGVLAGNFAFKYTGPDVAWSGGALSSGANLLSGSFDHGQMSLYQTLPLTGLLLAQNSPNQGWNLTLASDVVQNFYGGRAQQFRIYMTDRSASNAEPPYPTPETFTSAARGQFLSGVPEPSTWGMMILGFGLAGAAIRARRPLLA
jgi:hypothetical protein